MPGAEAIKDVASGLLAIPVSQLHASYVLWFRPEVVRTVEWGGEPQKPIEGGRIHPRQSFAVWKETVQRHSTPWDEAELDAAGQLRSAIVDIVLRKAEELAELNDQLVRSNKELEAFSYSVSHDLRAPFRHIVGYSELLKQYEGERLSERGHRYVDTIIESALSAGELVDDLLSFSQMGRATLHPRPIDMDVLVKEVRGRLGIDLSERAVRWEVADLPPAYGDPAMIRLVLQNLLENALKFTRGREPAIVTIGSRTEGGSTTYFVADNGSGFDMAYVGKLFGVFQRLHRVEDYEGTGIGLANVKRIVEHRHGGRVWADAKLDQGATFYFTLPSAPE
jgi:light-regulated signal transduction histidine kinase (bacteriophytochrome)